MLDAPVPLNRYLLHAGERIEILVDFSNDQGDSLDLKNDVTIPRRVMAEVERWVLPAFAGTEPLVVALHDLATGIDDIDAIVRLGLFVQKVR